MAKIYSYLLIVSLIMGIYSCRPHDEDSAGLGKVIAKEDIKVSISFDENNSNIILFKLLTPGCQGRFMCPEAGINQTGLEGSKLVGWKGDYILKVQVYNEGGLSDVVEMPFHIDTDIYAKYLAGENESGKKWRINGAVSGHIGCGPESATWNEWWNPDPNSLDGALYDDDMIFYLSEKFYLDNKGASFMNESTAGLFPDGNPGGSFITTHYKPSDSATWKIVLDESGASWLVFTNGFPAYAVNPDAVKGGKYRIDELSETKLKLTYLPGGIAWHYELTSAPR